MPHYKVCKHRVALRQCSTFLQLTTEYSSRLWILFANCEPVPMIIAPRGRGKAKMEGDLSMVRTYIHRLVWMSIMKTGSRQGAWQGFKI